MISSNDNKFSRQFVVGLALVTLIAGWGGAALLHYALPGHYVKAYPFIPAFFFVWELLFVMLLRRNRGRGSRTIRLFLGMKVAKLLLFVLIIGLYTSIVGVQNADFVLTFLAFYIVYLIFETVYFGSYWRNKQKMQKMQSNE